MSLEILFHLASAVELVGCGEVAAFHLLEDGAGVDESAFREVEVDAGTQEFLGEHGDVEEVGVEAGKVAAGELLVELSCHLLERRFVSHVGILDTGELFHHLGDMLLGVDEHVASCLLAVGIHLNI